MLADSPAWRAASGQTRPPLADGRSLPAQTAVGSSSFKGRRTKGTPKSPSWRAGRRAKPEVCISVLKERVHFQLPGRRSRVLTVSESRTRTVVSARLGPRCVQGGHVSRHHHPGGFARRDGGRRQEDKLLLAEHRAVGTLSLLPTASRVSGSRTSQRSKDSIVH